MRKEVLEKITKMRAFNAIVVPTLLYGCEAWTILKRSMKASCKPSR